MSRTLLLTTGTSVANGTTALSAFQRRATSWEDDATELREQIRTRLQGYDLQTETGRVRASAELNILHRLPARPDDEVILLATGTQLRFPAPELLQPLIQAQKGVEVMDIRAACRTYNVLVSENRRVAAALLFA